MFLNRRGLVNLKGFAFCFCFKSFSEFWIPDQRLFVILTDSGDLDWGVAFVDVFLQNVLGFDRGKYFSAFSDFGYLRVFLLASAGHSNDVTDSKCFISVSVFLVKFLFEVAILVFAAQNVVVTALLFEK